MKQHKNYAIKRCEKCGRKMKRFRMYRGTLMCYKCYSKGHKFIGGKRDGFSIFKALNKIYEVRGYLRKSTNQIQANIFVPSILVGHKVKLILQDNKKDGN